jgi:hypothetical protein
MEVGCSPRLWFRLHEKSEGAVNNDASPTHAACSKEMMKGVIFMPMPSTECRECGGVVTRVRKDYHYKECGLQNVMLIGINVNVCSTCHAEQPEIISIAALHRAIMIELLKKRSLLCGEEIRYLRKMARFKASELAAHISADPTSI